jgi:hypothetical protein
MVVITCDTTVTTLTRGVFRKRRPTKTKTEDLRWVFGLRNYENEDPSSFSYYENEDPSLFSCYENENSSLFSYYENEDHKIFIYSYVIFVKISVKVSRKISDKLWKKLGNKPNNNNINKY